MDGHRGGPTLMQVIERKVPLPWAEVLPVVLIIVVGAWARASGDVESSASLRALLFGVTGTALLTGTIVVRGRSRPLLTGLWALMFVEAAAGFGTALANRLPGDDPFVLARQTNAALGASATITYILAIAGAAWWGGRSVRHAFMLIGVYAVVFAPIMPSVSFEGAEPSYFVVQWLLLPFALAAVAIVPFVVRYFEGWTPVGQRNAVVVLFALAIARTALVYSPVIFIATLRGIDSIVFGLLGFGAIYGGVLCVTWLAVKARANTSG